MSTVDYLAGGADRGHWALPDGVGESLPQTAAHTNALRQELLTRFAGWGYQLVETPLVEFQESLLTGSGRDLDLQTVRVTDQVSGRLLGVRADMTPQVARIDAHRLREEGATRLCYAASVLRARPEVAQAARVFTQIGAELYGHAGVESDIEIMTLMLETVSACGIANLHIDLGHVGIFTALAEAAGLDEQRQQRLFDLLQRKAVTEIAESLVAWQVPADMAAALAQLAELNGGTSALDKAEQVLAVGGSAVMTALAELRQMAAALQANYPDVGLHLDLAELRGYRFHTGAVFAAFVPGVGVELARGGRYDDVGAAFGRARPATGFSADLNLLVQQAVAQNGSATGLLRERIAAPLTPGQDAALDAAVAQLRADGYAVLSPLPGTACVNCHQKLVKQGDSWQLQPNS